MPGQTNTPALSEEVKAKAGEVFAISLPSYSASGYVWRVRQPHEPVALVSREAVPGKKFGESGIEKLIFCCNKAGTYELTLDNLRPWESEERESKYYKVVIE